jgi:hypothetical protein
MEKSKFYIGQRVHINDESYVVYLDVSKGKPYSLSAVGGYSKNDICTVVAVDCVFPLGNYADVFYEKNAMPDHENDIFVFNENKKIFAFVFHGFISPVCQKPNCCPCRTCDYRGGCQ